MSTEPKSQRRTLYILIALFFVPLAASFILYYGTSWRPGGLSNNGELFTPAKPLPDSAGALRGKWTLIYVGNGACDERCRTALVFARQTRLALNQEMTRVDRAFLATDACCNLDYLDREHKGIKVFDVSGEAERAELLAALAEADREQSLFVVDPLGNLVMRYDVRNSPKGLLTDLKKLLKLSHIG
jgi:hypothetical protein